MSSTSQSDPDYVPSGFMHPDKRRVRGLGRGDESKRNTAETAELIGRVFVERSRRAKDLADAMPAVRAAKASNSRSRREAPKSRRKVDPRETFVGPTEARLAKGDVLIVGGVHRSTPPIEKLRKDLDTDAKTSLGMYCAAEKLRRHFEGHVNGSRATDSIDIDLAMSAGGQSDLNGDEGWVHHYDCFRQACRLMGYYPERPNHGCARIVVAVVCRERTIAEAGAAHLPSLRKERMLSITMDRLRSGLLTLALHWGFL